MSNVFARRFQLVVDQISAGNKKQFAELSGKSASHIYKICRGVSRPSMTYLQSLYDEFQIDLNWLLTGESASEQATGRALNKDLVHAPLFDVQASAGAGLAVNSEEITDNFAFNKRWLSSQLRVNSDNIAFIEVRGDSMQPTLYDGDMVLIDLSDQQVRSKGVYLLKGEGELMAKRVSRDSDGNFHVSSDNDQYPSWRIDAKDLQENPIAGRVVWCGRSL